MEDRHILGWILLLGNSQYTFHSFVSDSFSFRCVVVSLLIRSVQCWQVQTLLSPAILITIWAPVLMASQAARQLDFQADRQLDIQATRQLWSYPFRQLGSQTSRQLGSQGFMQLDFQAARQLGSQTSRQLGSYAVRLLSSQEAKQKTSLDQSL